MEKQSRPSFKTLALKAMKKKKKGRMQSASPHTSGPGVSLTIDGSAKAYRKQFVPDRYGPTVPMIYTDVEKGFSPFLRPKQVEAHLKNKKRSGSNRRTRKRGRFNNKDDYDKSSKESTRNVSKGRKRSKKKVKLSYCECCVQKYADFEQHIASEQHRRFATNDHNYAKLDQAFQSLAESLGNY